MRKAIEEMIQKLWIKKTFMAYKNSLPTTSQLENPKMEYNVMADAVAWEDEGLTTCHPDLGNAFRFVIYYRTFLIVNESALSKTHDSMKFDKQIFELAKKYFPDWIGFNSERCTYKVELSDKIKRIRKVSKWKMEKLFNYDFESD